MIKTRLLFLAALLPFRLTGQSTVQGDVYAVNGLGTVYRAAGVWVKLMRVDSAFLAASDSLCASFGGGTTSEQAATALVYSAEQSGRDNLPRYLVREKALARSRFALLLPVFRKAAIDSVQANIDGHFSLTLPTAGSYQLFAETRVGVELLQWWRDFTANGTSTVVDLGRDRLAFPYYCRPRG